MKILVVSHGPMCEAMLESAAMIAGENPSVSAVKLTETGIGDFSARLQSAIEACGDEPILILSDIKGGTPFNESFKFAMTSPDRIRLISGVNLPMLIEVSLGLPGFSTIAEAEDAAVAAGVASVEKTVFADDDDEDLF